MTGFPVVLCLAVAAPAADEEEGGSGETCDCESPPARFFSSESWSRAHGSSRDPLRTCQQICIKIIRNCWAQQFAKLGGSGNPAALNLDPDPGFLPYLNPDPGLCFQVWIINIKKAKRKKISFKKIFKNNQEINGTGRNFQPVGSLNAFSPSLIQFSPHCWREHRYLG